MDMMLQHTFVACVLSVSAAVSAAGQGPCPRPATPLLAQGAVIVIRRSPPPPCRVVLVDTPLALDPETNPSAPPDFAGLVYRAPDGSYFTSSNRNARIASWDPRGNFVRLFGGDGRGPGEFVRGAKSMLFTKDGGVYVGDNARRWSVFSPSLTFLGEVAFDGPTATASQHVLIDDESLVTSSRVPPGTTGNFRLFRLRAGAQRSGSADPPSGTGMALIREFGAPRTEGRSGGARSTLAHGGGETFWAAAVPGRPLSELQLWRTDGVLLRTLRIESDWATDAARAMRAPGRPPPELEMLHDDGTGILFLRVVIANERFGAPLRSNDAARVQQAMDAMVDVYFDVIDGTAGVRLASTGRMSPSMAKSSAPIGMFPGNRQGYRFAESPGGFVVVRIVDVHLVAR